VRRAARRDPNEAAIVAALRQAGASVYLLHTPLDLLVGYRDRATGELRCALVEVKRPPGPRGGATRSGQRLNPEQEAFVASWRGQWAVVTSPAEALRLIGVEVRDA
jgi:hypothetical protein